jgi:hypothetical protein
VLPFEKPTVDGMLRFTMFCEQTPDVLSWLKSIVDLRRPEHDVGGELFAHDDASEESDEHDVPSCP